MSTMLLQRSKSCRITREIGFRNRIFSSLNASRHYRPCLTIFTRPYQHRYSSSSGDDNSNDQSSSSPKLWEQLKSPPNLITLTRMTSTPLLAYWICTEQYNLAIWGCGIAAVSDALDGYLAKNYNWATTVGTYLDPISDKVVINGLAISLWYSGLLPTPIILLWGGKDATLLSGTAYLLHKKYNSINFFTTSLTEKPLTVTPSTVAKANTALQFLTIGVAIVTPVATSFPPMLLESLWCAFFFGGLVARFTPYTVLFLLLASIYFALFSWITGASTIGSSFSYMSKTGFRVDDAIGKEKKENGEASKKGTTR